MKHMRVTDATKELKRYLQDAYEKEIAQARRAVEVQKHIIAVRTNNRAKEEVEHIKALSQRHAKEEANAILRAAKREANNMIQEAQQRLVDATYAKLCDHIANEKPAVKKKWVASMLKDVQERMDLGKNAEKHVWKGTKIAGAKSSLKEIGIAVETADLRIEDSVEKRIAEMRQEVYDAVLGRIHI